LRDQRLVESGNVAGFAAADQIAVSTTSLSTHVPQQITATGFFALSAALTNACACGSKRMASPFITPPGNTTAVIAGPGASRGVVPSLLLNQQKMCPCEYGSPEAPLAPRFACRRDAALAYPLMGGENHSFFIDEPS